MSDAAEVSSIAFVGLGNMGGPMSEALVDAGRRVIGYDVDPAAVARLAGYGGHAAESAKAAIAEADVAILMLPDSGVVEQVIRQARGSIRPGSLVVDMSSSEPLRTTRLADELRALGADLIDAPVSGGIKGAAARTLTVMVGGRKEAVEEAHDLLATFGRVVEVGPVGSGHVVKALNNWLSATHLWVTSEAMVVGQRFGLDPVTMLDVFNGSSGRSGSTQSKWPEFILPGTFDSGFGLALMLKDVRIAVGLAEQLGQRAELGEAVVSAWQKAAEGLDPDADHTEVAAWIASMG